MRVYGGERGIRTLDTLLEYARFPGVCLKPLGHLSAIGQPGIGHGPHVLFHERAFKASSFSADRILHPPLYRFLPENDLTRKSIARMPHKRACITGRSEAIQPQVSFLPGIAFAV